MNNYHIPGTSSAFTINSKNGLKDEDLVNLIVKNKDESAFKSLVNRYATRTYYLALTFTLNRQLSKKVTEDVFISIDAMDTEYAKSDFKTWLFTIALEKSRKYLKELETTYKEDQLVNKNDKQVKRILTNRIDIKEHSLFYNVNNSSEFIPIIEKALYELPAPNRVAVLLRDIEKMSLNDIKRVLGFSVPTIGSIIHSSRLYIIQQISSHIKENRGIESIN